VNRPAVTEAESAVLAALWRRGPLPSKQLLEEVRRHQDWGDATIKTLLNRLMHKGAVRSDRADGVLRYVPMITRRDYVETEMQALADRLFDGRRDALAAYLAGAEPV